MTDTGANPFVNRIKPHVRALVPYELEHVEARIQLDMNENPLDMPAPIKEEVLARVRRREWTRYPELIPQTLLEKLSTSVHWPVNGLLLGNGSNEILKMIISAIADVETRVAVAQPSFSVYRQMVQLSGAQYAQVLLTPDLRFDVEAVCRAAAQADLLILCVPNNPTGTQLELDAARKILRAATGIVVLDEAYHEFSGCTAQSLLPEFPNLILLRTFSKAMAMGGLRVGYLMADPDLAIEIGKARLPYNLNFVSLTAAEVSLDHVELLRANVNQVIVWRERLREQLGAIKGLEVFPSGANFILIRTPLPAATLYEELYRRSILVRNVSQAPLLDRCLRITVGTEKENEQLIAALAAILNHN